MNPSLEEFSFSDDDGPAVFANMEVQKYDGSAVFISTKKKTVVRSDIGIGGSEIQIERVSKSNDGHNSKKISLTDKCTMTEDVNRKAEKTKIFAEKATMTDDLCGLEPLKRLEQPDEDEAHKSEQVKDFNVVPNFEDYIKRLLSNLGMSQMLFSWYVD